MSRRQGVWTGERFLWSFPTSSLNHSLDCGPGSVTGSLQGILSHPYSHPCTLRAPQPPAPLIPSFDDVLGALPAQPARSKALPAASQTVAADKRALAPEPATPAESAASSDLELVDEEGEEACNIVALPSTLKQRRPSTQVQGSWERAAKWLLLINPPVDLASALLAALGAERPGPFGWPGIAG